VKKSVSYKVGGEHPGSGNSQKVHEQQSPRINSPSILVGAKVKKKPSTDVACEKREQRVGEKSCGGEGVLSSISKRGGKNERALKRTGNF